MRDSNLEKRMIPAPPLSLLFFPSHLTSFISVWLQRGHSSSARLLFSSAATRSASNNFCVRSFFPSFASFARLVSSFPIMPTQRARPERQVAQQQRQGEVHFYCEHFKQKLPSLKYSACQPCVFICICFLTDASKCLTEHNWHLINLTYILYTFTHQNALNGTEAG